MELVDPSYQPTKADMENEWTARDMTLDEAARRVLESVKVWTTPRPRHNG